MVVRDHKRKKNNLTSVGFVVVPPAIEQRVLFTVTSRGGGGWNSHIKRTGVLVGVKKAVLVSLREFSLKKSTVGDFVVVFRVLS